MWCISHVVWKGNRKPTVMQQLYTRYKAHLLREVDGKHAQREEEDGSTDSQPHVVWWRGQCQRHNCRMVLHLQ